MTLLQIAFAAAAAVGLVSAIASRRDRRLPPGPRGYPLFGNISDIPMQSHWLAFSQWAKTYGEIISVRLFGQTIIVLNSVSAVRGVLVMQGAHTGARSKSVLLRHAGWEDDIGMIPPEKHRAVRRFMTKHLGPGAMSPYLVLEDEEVTSCITRILRQPGVELESNLKRMLASILMRIALGYTVESGSNEFVGLAQEALDIGLETTASDFITDSLPWLMFLPEWMLGPYVARRMTRSREVMQAVRAFPMAWTRKEIEEGRATPSVTSAVLALPDDQRSPELVSMISTIYIAGIDTMVSVCRTLFLVLALYPEAQEKGHREVDNLTKGTRLPTHADQVDLPYISAIVKEVYRYRGVVNMGIPHRAINEVQYNGYTIPKDAIIIPNIWEIFHDPAKYPDPYGFNPERYLNERSHKPEGIIVDEDPSRYVFGFGSRNCPGKHIAESTIFLFTARVLASVHISNAVDEHGTPITPASIQYTGGLVSKPQPFKCTITPRNNSEAEL